MNRYILNSLLTEGTDPIPLEGVNAGYVYHEKIDGHDVHVIHKHTRGGNYHTNIQVNGKHIADTRLPEGTRQKIVLFLAHTGRNFVKTIGPRKIRGKANTKPKADVYNAFGKVTGAHITGNGSRKTEKKIVLDYTKKPGAAPHRPSGSVLKDTGGMAKPAELAFSDKQKKMLNTKMGGMAFAHGLNKSGLFK